MLCVTDLDASIKHYMEALGCKLLRTKMTLCRVADLELVQNPAGDAARDRP